MKTIASGLLAHIQGEVLTLNTCVRVTRTDGAVFGFTDCDFDLVVGGQTYKSSTGIFGTQNQTTGAFNVDSTDVTSYLDSADLTEADLMAGVWDYATVQMFQVNRASLAAGTYRMRDGTLGQVTVQSPTTFKAELRGLTQALQKQLADLITPSCRWDLGDAHCKVDLATLAVTPVAVTSVTNRQAFAASGLAQPAGTFDAGKLLWLTGANTGRTMDILTHGSAGAIVLQLPMFNAIAAGDTATLWPGCKKSLQADCVTRYSNGVNFGGFPYLPGVDSMVRPGGV